MSNYHPSGTYGNKFELSKDLFEYFLIYHGFTPIEITGDKDEPSFEVYRRGDITIEVPRTVDLTMRKIKLLLTDTDLTVEDFKEFIKMEEQNKKNFDKLIYMSLKKRG